MGALPRAAPPTHSYLRLQPPSAVAAAAAAAAAPALVAGTAAAQAYALPALIKAAGVFVLCCAGAALLLAAIPVLLAAARAAHRAEALLRTIEAEIPDTMASMRLSGMELSDCLTELGALGSDLIGGVRASARMLSAAEQGVRAAPAAVARVVTPAIASTESRARARRRAARRDRRRRPHAPRAGGRRLCGGGAQGGRGGAGVAG
ncbi:hypothetical protein MNEG_3135 [Monoraphidium neglectum]|uniref:Uncharacterized protein n=1 Tax=Monoraphidium neglectum TaxID=145388 RepID=A0A0D2MWJ1_9CHLO|nr:hypothetical protein MNEG_3135 [Monoraphidium neglectum]KIZ04827.1 hypothetical protein MNEG_3135 [Monoraphidium neglectum]|eukprot:XP_013903846.1 hypothetical protein MNEG_3135 [Monoraphidium neglectum]